MSRPRIATPTYEIEAIDAGWIVWRTLPGRPATAVNQYAHPTRRNAEDDVITQRRADLAAATRLGLTLEEAP